MKNNIPLSVIAEQELGEFCDSFGSELVNRAVDKAIDENAPRWAYIRKILMNWQKSNVKTLADVIKLDEDYKNQRGGVGLGGVLVDVGVDTIVEEGKRTVEMNGKTYLIETALTAEVAIVYAKKADPFGNLVFDKSARNMNPHVAMAGEITIVEAEEIVPLGSLDPEEIVVPGVFVNYIVPSEGVNWKWVWA
ncbi:CoA-transferase [Bacillus sp. B-TM1]